MQPQTLTNKNIKLASFWPKRVQGDGGRDALLQQHESVRWAYRTDMQLIEYPNELNIPVRADLVSIEEESSDTFPLWNFIHPENAVYLTGNDDYRQPSYFWPGCTKVHIPVPSNGSDPMYSHQVWAIVMNHRFEQRGEEDQYDIHHDQGTDGKHWWSIDMNGKSVAFCSAEFKGEGVWYVGDSNVDPDYRRQGMYRAMSEARLAFIEKHNPVLVIIMTNRESIPVNEALGFKSVLDHNEYDYQEFTMLKHYN